MRRYKSSLQNNIWVENLQIKQNEQEKHAPTVLKNQSSCCVFYGYFKQIKNKKLCVLLSEKLDILNVFCVVGEVIPNE